MTFPALHWDERNYFSGGSSDPVSNSQKARHISMCSKSPSHIILNWRRTSPVLFFFLIGAITPVITWAMSRRFPKSFFKYIKCDSFFNPSEFLIFDDEFTSSMWSLLFTNQLDYSSPSCILTDDSRPVVFNGTGQIPPATAINYIPWVWVPSLLWQHVQNLMQPPSKALLASLSNTSFEGLSNVASEFREGIADIKV